MTMRLTTLPLLLSLLTPLAAQAERADRDKPVNLEADRITVDDANKVHILEGNVVLIKGTLVIRTDKLVVTQDAQGFQKAVAYGGKDGLARFKQKREGKNEYMDGEGERIEHDDRSEITHFIQRAYVKSGQDQVAGQVIVYDARKETYAVTGGKAVPGAAQGGQSGDGRVRAVIQPRSGTAPAPAEGSNTTAPRSSITLP